ncbi:MAG: hypothetical protein LAQ69_20960 [Acidobacteriia bacterium]|nr:hypothetical protein [Terriglobia bacterium]
MRRVEAILAATIAMSLAGCVLRGKPTAVSATTPVAPKPMPAPTAPAPPPPQLSVPQTQVELPAPQPLSAEAAASTEPPEEAPITPVVRKPSGNRRSQTPPQPRTETVAPPTPVAQPPQPTETERGPIQEIVPQAELNRLQTEAGTFRKTAQQRLDQLRKHRLKPEEQSLRDSVLSYIKLSEQAERQGDIRKAYQAADRAQALAKDLPDGK